MTSIQSAFRRVHRQLKPNGPLPEIQTEFFPSVGANHTAVLERGLLRVRVSDLFVDAPREVFEALAAILLSKLYRKKLDPHHRDEYRRYLMTGKMLARSKRVRAARGRRSRTTGPVGRVWDLSRLFDQLNARYFGRRLPKPELSWTERKARSVLGRYDFEQDIIFISRFLDSATIPDHVVEYILFHEMLHVKHGTQINNLKEIVHSPAFRREEQQFEHYVTANRWLQRH